MAGKRAGSVMTYDMRTARFIRSERKDGPMKAGISFLLGLLLAFVLVFGYWLRTPHRLGARWNAVDQSLNEIDQPGDPATH